MLEYAGTDATMAFADKPHSLDAWLMLEKYLIGELVAEERMFEDQYSSWQKTNQEITSQFF